MQPSFQVPVLDHFGESMQHYRMLATRHLNEWFLSSSVCLCAKLDCNIPLQILHLRETNSVRQL
jgi:hypothetical protein